MFAAVASLFVSIVVRGYAWLAVLGRGGVLHRAATALGLDDVSLAPSATAIVIGGTVWINAYNTFDAAVPSGGFKSSGYGRDGGRAALEQYVEPKAVWTHLA